MNNALTFGNQHERAVGRPVPFVRQQRWSPIGPAVDRGQNAVGRSVKALAEGIDEGRRMSQLADELAAVSDRELADLGISSEAGSRPASARKCRLSERTVVFVGHSLKARRERWMTEEAAKGLRQRTLLEDNPTSG